MRIGRSGLLVSLLLSCCLLPVLVFAQPADPEPEDGGIWIDLRSPQEFREGHIEGAINIPRGEISHRIGTLVTDLYQPIHLYGSNPGFVGLALNILIELGYQWVVNEGSYEALLARRDRDRG